MKQFYLKKTSKNKFEQNGFFFVGASYYQVRVFSEFYSNPILLII